MDRTHVESHDRVRQNFRRLQVLLRGGDVPASSSDGRRKIQGWLCSAATRGGFDDPFWLEKAGYGVREFHERSLPQGRAFGVHPKGVRGDER